MNLNFLKYFFPFFCIFSISFPTSTLSLSLLALLFPPLGSMSFVFFALLRGGEGFAQIPREDDGER